MPHDVQLQLFTNASITNTFQALTDSQALPKWFAEEADVSIDQKRYDFWGCYTPETPDQTGGSHPITNLELDALLAYTWHVRGEESTVHLQLKRHQGQTVVILHHQNVGDGDREDPSTFYSMQDFWFLSLENLRRHLDGKDVVRCDFSQLAPGSFEQSVEIEATADTVFDTLIRPDQLERWIASKAKVEPEVGGIYDFGWGAEGGPVKILEIVPSEKLVYNWGSWRDDPETVTYWTLEESGGTTRLTLVHSGFAPDQPTQDLQVGWHNFLLWIKSISEYGARWQPPIAPVDSKIAPFYAASIVNAQGQLI
ncbi:SRPBCC domain-containing protein [Chloroflexi bacterium TSY]|nr:SRPBCC domain-containing protein [Chloroflexi bacterium TSY]